MNKQPGPIERVGVFLAERFLTPPIVVGAGIVVIIGIVGLCLLNLQ